MKTLKINLVFSHDLEKKDYFDSCTQTTDWKSEKWIPKYLDPKQKCKS